MWTSDKQCKRCESENLTYKRMRYFYDSKVSYSYYAVCKDCGRSRAISVTAEILEATKDKPWYNSESYCRQFGLIYIKGTGNRLKRINSDKQAKLF